MTVTTITTAGMSDEQVAAAVAADIAADPTLSAAGVTASSLGGRVTTSGVIQATVSSDAGISLNAPVYMPVSTPVALALLAATLLGAGAYAIRWSRS